MKVAPTGPQAKRTGISGNASLKRGALLVTFQAALQHGSFFRLPLVPLFDLAELFLDLTKGRGVDNEVSLGRQVFDLAKGAHDALEEGGMGSEEAG